jgi:carboxymethylenebutenolidase
MSATDRAAPGWTRSGAAGEAPEVWVDRPAGRAPGVVLLHEIFGVNTAMRACAADLAAAGFAVAAPDLFWRLQSRVDLGYGEPDRSAAFAYWSRFDADLGARDAAATARWLRLQPWCSGHVAYLGFCLGGQLAVKAAALAPAPLVSFYGVRLEQEAGALGQLAAAAVPMQFHFGTADAHVPAASVAEVRAALGGAASSEVFTHEGAAHGFFNPMRETVYHAEAAGRAREELLSFLRRELHPRDAG